MNLQDGCTSHTHTHTHTQTTSLSLQQGEIIIVTKRNDNGIWEGEINGRKGHFPFTSVELISS